MNTLLPFASFNSIGLLSNADLGVQIWEAGELIYALEKWPNGTANNQAALQWFGHIDALKDYYNVGLMLWVKRGFTLQRKRLETDLRRSILHPVWVGDPRVHAFHRQELLRKNPVFYFGQYGWKEERVQALYPNMHEYGSQIREHVPTTYRPMVAFNWAAFYKGFDISH